jgi:signal peptidase I
MDGLEQQATAGDVTPPRPKTPRPIVAAALSLLQGGLGQVYSGRTWRGAAWFLVSDVASVLAFHAMFLAPTPATRRLSLATAVLLFALGRLAGAIDAWRVARSRRALGPPLGRPWLRAVAAFVVAFIASGAVQVALRGMTDARRYYRVNGHSMLPLLADEDRVVGVVPEESYRPQRGDVVAYEGEPGRAFLGRVIGLSGDRIDMPDGFHASVNGRQEATWDRVIAPTASESAAMPSSWYPRTRTIVPAGCVFILGDNRVNSRDSRHRGSVAINRIVARLEWWLFRRSEPRDFGEPIER